MTKRTIYALSLLISLGLLGLVCIQYIVVKNAFDTRKVQFTQLVKSALVDVTDDLQKSEAKEWIARLNYTQLEVLDDGGDSLEIVFLDDGGMAVMQRKISRNPDVDEKVYQELKNNKDKKLAYGRNAGIRIENKSTEVVLDGISRTADTSIEKQLQSLEIKYELFNDMVDQMHRFDQNVPLSEQIDTLRLYALLTDELKARGINAEFIYRIESPGINEVIYFGEKAKSYDKKLNESAFSIVMFPGEISEMETQLTLYFPYVKWNLLGDIAMLLIISGLFIALIILVFIVSLRVIFRQKRLSEIKNDFISNMTHELKTPISTISLACEALADPTIDLSQDSRGTYLQMIRAENGRLSMLVEKVLQNTLLEKGEVILNPELVALNPLIENTLSHFDLRIRKKGGTIHLSLDPNLPMIFLDPVHTGNAISNLIDNAIKYTPGQPKIQIRTYSADQQVVIEVEDNGMGISAENQKVVFEKFFRVPTGNVHNVKGFGLGLSYVHYVISNSKGSVSVKSELGKGSIFTIKIPINHEQ